MIQGLIPVSRSYDGLLVPIAKYTLTNIMREQSPKIATAVDFGKKPVIDDLQVDVYETTPAIENLAAVYDNKIITAYMQYGSFYVNCYAQTRDEAKQWIDVFENNMVKKNQYRGKCLYAEKESMFFKEVPKVLWDDVILTEKAKKDIRLNTSDFLGNQKFAASGVNKCGLVMYGPPGTGKTSVVKAIFNELEGKKVSRIYVTAESFKYMQVSKLFEFLAYLGPTVLAFEDIDFISGNRDLHTSGVSNQLGDLLTNLDGMRKFGEPLVVIASTNKMEMLDSALANRPCRFDRRIEIGLPTAENLKLMYFKHLGKDVTSEIINLSKDFTGSHVVETVNTAKILATNEDKQTIDCLKEACEIIRENFFPGQSSVVINAAIQTYLIKKGYIKKASKIENKIQKIAHQIIKQAEFDDDYKKFEDAVVEGIYKKVPVQLRKYVLGKTEKDQKDTIRKDVNADFLDKQCADYFQDKDASVEKAVKGLLDELMVQYHGSAGAM
jgi:SpoVK/Ycf46/Vps4 family AAA+-type ATPase